MVVEPLQAGLLLEGADVVTAVTQWLSDALPGELVVEQQTQVASA